MLSRSAIDQLICVLPLDEVLRIVAAMPADSHAYVDVDADATADTLSPDRADAVTERPVGVRDDALAGR